MGCLDFSTKLNQLKVPIKKWNKDTFGHIDNNISKLEQEKLDVKKLMEEGVGDEEVFERQKDFKVQLKKWYKQRTSY